MRQALLPCLFMLTLAAPATFAQVLVGWGGSPTNGASSSNDFDCTSNSGFSTLVVSIVPPADLLGVSGFALDLVANVGDGSICDTFTGAACLPPPLPPYWDLGTGGCRAGAISPYSGLVGASPPSPDAVTDPWTGALTVAQPWTLQTILNLPGALPESSTTGHYHVDCTLFDGATVDLLAGHEYYVASIVLRHTKSAGSGDCAGCCMPVVIVPSARLFSNDAPAGVTFTQLQDGPAFWHRIGCAVVPTRASTWGALKSAYR